MDAKKPTEPAATKHRTTVERVSDRELLITRTFDGPARLVFEAWSKAELLKRWWTPKSIGMTMLSCEADVRTGGTYRFVFRHGDSDPMAFYGRYIEVTPPSRIVWTNEESGADGSVTTLTLEEKDGKTHLVMRDVYPSKEALDAGGGAAEALPEQFDQLDDLLAANAR